jgi:hypothetical protein
MDNDVWQINADRACAAGRLWRLGCRSARIYAGYGLQMLRRHHPRVAQTLLFLQAVLEYTQTAQWIIAAEAHKGRHAGR